MSFLQYLHVYDLVYMAGGGRDCSGVMARKKLTNLQTTVQVCVSCLNAGPQCF